MSDLAPAEGAAAPTFSYGDLSPDAVGTLQFAAMAIRHAQRSSLREIGSRLLQAKEVLPHGRFTAWVEAELGMTGRSARNIMQAAAFLDGKPETISDLPPTILYTLSAPSAPADVVEEVVKAAATGAPLDAVAIETRLSDAKRLDAELRVAQRSKPDLTRADLQARKAEKQRREERRRQADRDENAAERQKAEARVAPVIDRLIAADPQLAREVLSILGGPYQQAQAMRDLLPLALEAASRLVPARPVPERETNGNNIRAFIEHLREGARTRSALASELCFLIRDQLWTDFEMVAGRPGSFATLREMLLTERSPGLCLGDMIEPLREILGSFEEGRQALEVFEAEFAKGADGSGGT